MNCHSKVQKWGNSLGIRIRRSIADQLDLKENTEVDITIQDNRPMQEAVYAVFAT
ncbi:AbrB/MazE/SpoVT family DNA-binding domain-containing protein [Candidatus Latescibacterota bacterium]